MASFCFATCFFCLAMPADDQGVPPPDKRHFVDFALRHEGNVERGKVLFSNPQRLACSQCHTVDGKGGKAGPDLFAVGDKFGRRDLMEAVLSPSATIAVGYNTVTVETRDGEETSGIVKEANDQIIGLMGADGRVVRVPKSKITDQRTSEISLMPEGLQNGLTLAEFNDLIEYLASLKQPENAALYQQGMPAEIPMLSRPVELHPFITEDLRFAHPVWFGPVPGQTNVFLVVEHETGRIWRLQKHRPPDNKTLFAELGEVQKGARGLIGMVLHPDFRRNRKYYVARHVIDNGRCSTLIQQREAAPDLKSDSGKPPRLIIRLEEVTGVHYGGSLAFGPDGYLYVGIGDSGPQEDPEGHAQDRGRLLGKILRLDVERPDSGRGYAIPSDNPFVGRADTRPEIWALGLREPWRFSFDPATGDLWVGDVGQDRYEEVDCIRRGENYGWNVYEGFAPFSNRYKRDAERFTPPVFAYGRKFGASVTGGFVYREKAGSSFYGVYVFGDYQSHRLFGLRQAKRRLEMVRQLGVAPEPVVSFGRGAGGELYVVGYDGMIFQMDFEQSSFP